MKAIKFLFGTLAALMLFAGCDELYGLLEGGLNGLKLSKTSLEFEAAGGSQSVEITASLAWEVECDASWIKVTPANGVASTEKVEVTFEVAENTGEAREAEVEFSIQQASQILKITQKAAPAGPDNPGGPGEETTGWGIVGDINNWGNPDAATGEVKKDIPLEFLKDSFYVAKNVEFPESGFKIRKNNEWNDLANLGLELQGPVEVDHVYQLVCGGGSGNMLIAAGKYDVYLNEVNLKAYIMTPGKDYWEAVVPGQKPEVPADPTDWHVSGLFNDWNAGDPNYKMAHEKEYYTFLGLTLEAATELKFTLPDWSINRGGNFAKNAALDLIDGGPNFMVPAGTYDIFMTKDASVVYFMDKGFAPENLYVEMGLSKVHTLEPGSYVLTSGAVAAAYSRSVLLTDGNYYTLVYDGTGSLSNYQVGDVLQVRAQAQRYAGMIQLQSASVALVGRSDIATPTPVVYTAANVNELLGQTVPSYIQYEGKLKHSGNYFNVEIEGTQIIGSVSNPMGDIKALLDANDGAIIKVTGYYVGMTGNNVYMNTMATAVEVIKQAEETPEVAPTVATVDKFLQAAEDDTWYQLTGKISNVKSAVYGNFDLVDETGSVYVYGLTATKVASNDKSYATLGLKEGDVVTLVGKRTSYKGSPQVGGPAYYVSHVVGENPGEGGEVTPPAEEPGLYDPQGITWTLGSGAYDINSSVSQTGTVNGVELGNVLKLGKGSAVGSATLHIPAGTKKVGAYIIAWKGKNETNLKFSVGGTEILSMTPKANDGATGNPPYTITVTDSDWYEMDVPATGAIDVVVETTDPSQGRVIIIGLKAIK